MKMRNIAYILMLADSIMCTTCDRSTFEMEVSFSDLLFFEEFTLEPPSDKSRDHCAQECHRNPSCTTFSIFLGAHVCQLYGDVAYPDVATAPVLSGRRYYVYTKERCPNLHHFVTLRQSNLCIRTFNNALNYDDVVAECEELEAHPIVLEDEAKATAVMDLLQKNGDEQQVYYLGARIQGTPPNFIWSDGQVLTRDWWDEGEPNNVGGIEDCIVFYQNRMVDVPCTETRRFICEIPQ